MTVGELMATLTGGGETAVEPEAEMLATSDMEASRSSEMGVRIQFMAWE